jgi:hypothetical protein
MTEEIPGPHDTASIRAAISRGYHEIAQDPGMHEDDKPHFFILGYGERKIVEDVKQLCRDLTLLDERLKQAMLDLARDGSGLTLHQEQAIRKALRL